MKKNLIEDDRKNRVALSRRDMLVALGGGVSAVGATILIGCGGGSGADSVLGGQSGSGRATMTIVWPDTTAAAESRLIPTAAKSIVVNILQNSQIVATQTVARPSTGTTSTVTFATLPVGTLPVQVQAYPNVDGTGTIQASATTNIDIVSGQSTPLTVTMASTIDHVTLTAAASSIAVGATTALTLTALDASGATVLISSSTVTFTALSSAVATVDSSGTVTGIAAGSASFRAIETESGKAATVSVTVTVVSSPSPSPSVASCTLIPQETQGPYPLLSVLSNSAIVRQNVTEGKTGVPLTLNLTFVNVGNTCGPVTNAAIYIWHCDKDGAYSGYSSSQNGSHSGETFMRGIQVTDSNGKVSFTTIYPGWYAGRITHIHFQAYLHDNLNVTATTTSQLAFPQAITQAVYASSLYAGHGQNSSVTSFNQDNVFSDGTTYQMLTVTGDVNSGYVASIVIGIAGS